MILHVDANSFYASCERVFRPDLDGKPIAVLSNNDGVIIALNQECKELGFKRGDVFFKVKDKCREKGVQIFSSNYTLYADLSARLNTIYNQFCPDVEFYSIDESFLLFPDWLNADFASLGFQIRKTVMESTHIPVSVGGARTKTLAKMCNKLAKKQNGVFILEENQREKELSQYKVEDIWGIGCAKAKLLHSLGIFTALDLANMSLDKANRLLTITGVRTIQELRGIRAIELQEHLKKDNISASKSFARGVTQYSELETALCEYTQLAIERMLSQESSCTFMEIFLSTAYDFSGKHPELQYCNYGGITFNEPVNYLPDLIKPGCLLLRKLYRPGFYYRKLQVSLMGLKENCNPQQCLFSLENDEKLRKKALLMKTFSVINEKYGRGCLHLGLRNQTKDEVENGGLNEKAAWIMTRNFLSPEYTTQLSQIPEVYSGKDSK